MSKPEDDDDRFQRENDLGFDIMRSPRHHKEDPREVLLALPHILKWLVIGLIEAGHTTHEGGAKVLPAWPN